MAITPGPWHYDGRRWIRDAAGIGVLRVQKDPDRYAACLAAAAPMFLEALIEIGAALHNPKTTMNSEQLLMAKAKVAAAITTFAVEAGS